MNREPIPGHEQFSNAIATVALCWAIAFLLLLAFCSTAHAQTAGATMPWVRPQFFDNNGVVAAGYKVCTYGAGGAIPQATYQDSGLVTPNANPVMLDVSGRPINGVNPVNIFLSGTNYKFVLMTPGTDNTCATGSVVWTQDNIGDIGQILKANLALGSGSSLVGWQQAGASAVVSDVRTKLRQAHFFSASDFSGSDIGDQINKAYAALPATGGDILVDSSATFSTPIVIGVSGKCARLVGVGSNTIVLTYSGTGIAVTDNCWDLNAGNPTFQGAHGITNIRLVGPGSGTATTGFSFGTVGGNGAQGAVLQDVAISDFGACVAWGDNSWGTTIERGSLSNCGKLFTLPTNTGTGEQMNFIGVKFVQDSGHAAAFTNGIVVNLTGNANFIGCVFDDVQIALNSGVGVFVANHFEDLGFAWTAAPISITGGVWSFFGNDATNNHALPADGVFKMTGGTATDQDGSYFYGGAAATPLITNSGGTFNFRNYRQVVGFTNTNNHQFCATSAGGICGNVIPSATVYTTETQPFTIDTTQAAVTGGGLLKFKAGSAGCWSYIEGVNIKWQMWCDDLFGRATVFNQSTGQNDLIISPTDDTVQFNSGHTFAQISAFAGSNDGSVIYCSDCKNVVDDAAVAAAACVAGGHGALARRQNGHWDCN